MDCRSPSTALFSEKHCTWCWFRFRTTATCAVLAANHCAGAPSSEHEIPATPDGPALDAVAVTYWVPAVDGTSAGPQGHRGRWLST